MVTNSGPELSRNNKEEMKMENETRKIQIGGGATEILCARHFAERNRWVERWEDQQINDTDYGCQDCAD